MAAPDLAAALAAVRARHRADKDDEGPIDLRDAGEKEDEAAEQRDREDAARRSRDASMSRAQLVDFAAQRGVRLSRQEEVAPMDALRKVILDRIAGLAVSQ
ncbi:hypothetical protein [Xanthobacter autotrophicus]|uniref:hypothetical protein n=1 Tax=Xanthobacter autotrophicus TaxID=280 RepID=UPI0024A6383C|nr:hypothetical protein [Xanthobacter autotrophicus]MDI4656017.1 hypothetical protein [Xanthobacter autotrophicus]